MTYLPSQTSENASEREDRLLTVRDVADLIQVATTFVYRHAAEIGALKVGSHLRFRKSDVEAWLESRGVEEVRDCHLPVDNRSIRKRIRKKKG